MKLPQLTGYDYEELLGEGPCGWVFRCSWNGGAEQRAVKILKAQAINRALVASCVHQLSTGKIKHPALPEIYETDLAGRPMAFAMPLFGRKSGVNWNSQSLGKFCGTLPPEHGIALVDQLADGMACLHRNGIFHTALKPTNLFVESQENGGYQIKISDPGQGYSAGVKYLEMGDAGFYASLEQLETGDYTDGKGLAWDVYAFGVVAFQLLTGKLPRLEARFQQFKQNPAVIAKMPAVAHGELMEGAENFIQWLRMEQAVRWPDQPQTDKEASRRFVIEKCLALNPADRFADMREVREALIQSDHQIQMNRISLAAQEKEAKGVKRAKIWKVAAMVALTLFGVSLLGTGIVWGIGQLNVGKKDDEITNVQRTAEEQQAALEKAIAERESNNAQLKTNLQNKEESEQFLLGKASHARHLARLSQENSDRFFEFILKNRDSDIPGFKEERRRILTDARKYYETVIEAYQEDPEFTLSVADAHRNLGEIYAETGYFQEARTALAKAAEFYGNLIQVNSTNVDITRGMARVRQVQADVSEKIADPRQTIDFLVDARERLDLLAKIEPASQEQIYLEIAQNYLATATAYRRAGDDASALSFAEASGNTFRDLRESRPQDDRILAGLAETFSISGELLRGQEKNPEAVTAFQQAADLYAAAVTLNGAIDDYQLGFGHCLGQIALLENDTKKLAAAAEVLAEVVPDNPFKSRYQTTLAEIFGAISKTQRDGGQNATALELTQKAVALLRPIVENTSAVPADVRFVYAQRLSDLADLQGDAGQFKESRVPLDEAIQILDNLVQNDPTNSRFRRALALSRGLAGFASVKAGDTNSARQHFQVAKVEWDNYVAQFPNDLTAAEAARWTREQLSELQ